MHKLSKQIEDLKAEAEKENASDPSKVIAPKTLTECLLSITHIDQSESEEAETIAMETLIDAHHPFIGKFESNAFPEAPQNTKICLF